jgi:hypothetical protein
VSDYDDYPEDPYDDYAGDDEYPYHRYDEPYDESYSGANDFEDDPVDLDLDALFEDNLNAIERWARPTFMVLAVAPSACSSVRGCLVTLDIEPAVEGSCFCRFGSVVVKGVAGANGTVLCRAPPHELGHCQLHFSKDRKNWFGPVEFSFGASGGLESVLVFAPAGILMMVVCGVLIWGLSGWAQARAEANLRELAIVRRARR